MKELHLVIASPEQTVFDGKVDMAVLPGELGEFQVLVNHAPLISSLMAGKFYGRMSFCFIYGENCSEFYPIVTSFRAKNSLPSNLTAIPCRHPCFSGCSLSES